MKIGDDVTYIHITRITNCWKCYKYNGKVISFDEHKVVILKSGLLTSETVIVEKDCVINNYNVCDFLDLVKNKIFKTVKETIWMRDESLKDPIRIY